VRRLLVSTLVGSLALATVAPAVADPATAVREVITFPDADPCTGETHEVTIDVTFLVHFHDGVTVARGVRTLTTSSGYAGRGRSSYVENGRVEKFRFSDRVTDDSGNRIRASGVFVVDRSTGAVRVDKFDVTCLGR
jgi:hypothetical protein